MGKKDYPREEKDGEIGKLKRHIRHLEKENSRLKSELRSYEKALARNITFLKERTENLSLEDLLKGAEAELSLQEIKKDKIDRFEDMKKKWECHRCQIGIMKFIVIPREDKSHYFRKCSNPKCPNRTDLKELTEDVDKGI